MNKYIGIMKRTTELADTCLKGLEHIRSKLNQGEFNSTLMMFHDSANAFHQMQKSIQPVLKNCRATSWNPCQIPSAIPSSLLSPPTSRETGARCWRSCSSPCYPSTRSDRTS